MRHASLFSGIGGFDLAASWMGWKNVFQVEKDDWCRDILKNHFPQTKQYEDIKDFNGENYYGAIDIISGGFPCQPFSVAGKQKGKTDDRYLWPEMLRVIRQIQPTWIVGENVPGIVSMALDTVLFDLESEGYACQTYIIPACAVNAIHRRDRVWILAYSEGLRYGRGGEGNYCKPERQGTIYSNKQNDRDKIRSKTSASDPPSSNSQHDGSPNGLETRERTLGSGEERGVFESERENPLPKHSQHNGCTTPEIPKSIGKTIQEPQRGERKSFDLERASSVSTTESNVPYSDLRRNRRHERESSEEGPVERSGSPYYGGGYKKLRFPISQPTICRGDDGVSYRLDNENFLTAKQRKNSLHSLGNAVVPQVVYEIFRIIERIEEKKSNV